MPARILVVDDDPDMVDMLRQALDAAGHSVETALTGPEGLHKAQQAPPDLILLDLLLPELNGYNVCQTLRQVPATASIPVIMMTVLPGEFPRMAGVEAGADAYVNKPFQLEELLSQVDALLERGRAQKPNRRSRRKLAA
jgi:DNA-binding response OmpR family regulator